MAQVRIYQRAKNAMQSGRYRTGQWVLEHEPKEAKRPDALTGWAGSGDTATQLRLSFPTLEAATAYAVKEGFTYDVIPAAERTLKIQTYADNFK